MPGRKRESDTAAAKGFYRHMHQHSEMCRCGHPEWRHMGINEPACTYLGSCPCTAFDAQRRTA